MVFLSSGVIRVGYDLRDAVVRALGPSVAAQLYNTDAHQTGLYPWTETYKTDLLPNEASKFETKRNNEATCIRFWTKTNWIYE